MAEAEKDSGEECEESEVLQVWGPTYVEMDIPFSLSRKEVVPGEISAAPGGGGPTDEVIYMQPGCSLLGSTGHADDEQRRLEELLDQQQVVEVTVEEEVALNLGTGDGMPRDLKGGVDHNIVSSVSEAPTGNNNTGGLRDPMIFMQNAAQQLQTVAQHVALQNKLNAVTRLVQQKLESIQIQIQPFKMKEKLMPPLAAINPQTVKLVQPLNQTLNKSGLNIGPQVFQLQPLTGNGEQQFILQSSPSNPSIQLLVQRNLPHVGPAPFAKKTNPHMKPTISADGAFKEDHIGGSFEKKQKQKKSLKVKTRSGRVSRPPKHKAKDYKFIKTGDLADGHPSDSDDYSELSVEEGDAMEKDALFNSSNCILKPKTFKCDSCEKCYIGKGGLARHYKLNPEHGSVDCVQQKAVPMLNGNDARIVVDSVGNHYASGSLSHGVTCANPESVSSPHAEEMDSVCGQQSGRSVEAEKSSDPLHEDNVKLQWLPIIKKGPGRPKGCKRSEKPRKHEIQRSRRHSRCPQPAKSLARSRAENPILHRKSRLKELLQECEIEDLMELALPLLAKLVTVYEFLIMKVEKGHPAKPFFPDVYREFEKLHEMVQNMAQDHFNNVSYMTIQQTLEVKNPKVAESLGIKEKHFGNENHNLSVSRDSSLKEGDGQLNMDISHQNPAHASSDQENFPPAKKMKSQNVCKNKLNICEDQNDLEKNKLNLSIQSAQKGSVWQQNEMVTVSDTNSIEGICPKPDSASNTNSDGHTCEEVSNQKAIIDSSHSDLLLRPAYERLDYSQSALFAIRSKGHVANSKAEPGLRNTLLGHKCKSEELAERQFENQNSKCKALNSETSISMPSVNIVDSLVLRPPNGQLSQHIDQGLQQDAFNPDTLKVHEHSELNGTIDHMQHLEDTFLGNLPTDHQFLYKTQSESSHCILQPPVTSKLKHLNELQCTINEESNGHSEMENVVTEVESVSFDIANEGHELFTQGYEQLFIQTTDGLVMSSPGTSVLPQPEGIFIVTNGDGTTMHISTPSGVSLETVEALLAMEAEGQSEAILISQSESE
ncbi:zinc finger protein 839 isoform X2 [Lissotriton helveticus]